MTGSKKCEPDCQCRRHLVGPKTSANMKGRKLRKCELGCTCGKHAATCKPGCTCSRHARHPPNCACGVHDPSPQLRESQSRGQQRRWATMSDDERRDFGDTVSKSMIERGLTSRSEEKRLYGRHHMRVRTARGEAIYQACVSCDEQAQEWAQVHGTDGSNPHEHFQPMCRKCHWIYDDRAKKIGKTQTGKIISAESRAKMSEAAKTGKRHDP
jgi:hypothetical protein